MALGSLALLTTGCRVATTVTVAEPAPGQGTITVAVVLDPDTVVALGGVGALRSELSVSDLDAAGWVVSGPTGRLDGSVAVTASHAFDRPSQVSPLMAQIAGTGVFRATLMSHRSFWHTRYTLSGSVDLRCGVNCFGDAGLKSATGYPLGFDPGAVVGAGHQAPESVLTFAVSGLLPGTTVSSNGVAGAGALRSWTPKLGQVISLSETSQTLNEGSVVLVAVLGGCAALVLLAAISAWVVRRRRRQRRISDPTGEGRGGPISVTPGS